MVKQVAAVHHCVGKVRAFRAIRFKTINLAKVIIALEI